MDSPAANLRLNAPNWQAHQQAAIPLPLVATLPPAQAQQNQHLLQQFPLLTSSLQLAAQEKPPSPVTVLVTPVGHGTDRMEVKVQTTGTGNPEQLSQAITKYMRSSCVIQSILGGIIVKTPDEATRKALDTTLKNMNTLSALVQHLGGNADTFVKLLGHPSCSQALQAFTGNPPQVVLQQIGNQVLLVVMPEAQEESLVAAASLLNAAGANEQAMSLLAEAVTMGHPATNTAIVPFVNNLLQGHLPADASRAAEACKRAMWRIPAEAFVGCMQKIMQALFAQGHPKLALELALMQGSGEGLDATLPEPMKIGKQVEMLKIVFDLAWERQNGPVVEEAINALGELEEEAPAAKEAFASRLKLVEAHNKASSDDDLQAMLDTNRGELAQAGFSFTIGMSESAPLEALSKFDAAEHGNLLLNQAEAVADASFGRRHATRFGLPVAQFMLDHFEELPPAAQVRLGRVCAKLIANADAADAMVHKLQLAIEHQLLSSAISAAVQAGKASSSSQNNPGVNALMWLLNNRVRLFSTLKRDDVDTMLTAALKDLGAPMGIAEIDGNAALATLKPAVSPSLNILETLLGHSRVALTSPLTEASRQHYTALSGKLPISELLVMRRLLNVPLQNQDQVQQLQNAFTDVLVGLQRMPPASLDAAQLSHIHAEVIDAIVELAQRDPNGPGVAQWCIEMLDKLLGSQVMRANPNADQWLHLARICVNVARDLDRAHRELTNVCKLSHTLDRRLELTIRLVIRAVLENRAGRRVASVYEALCETITRRAAIIARGNAWEGVQPLELTLLVQITSGYVIPTLRHGGRIGVAGAAGPHDVDVVCYMLTELSHHGMKVAHDFLLEVARVLQNPQTPIHASIACSGFLHLAALHRAKGDLQGMLQMLTAALGHLPASPSDRQRVLPALVEFIDSLRRTGTLPGDIAEQLRQQGL